MLMDVIGIVIAFATVMLLLSVVVTSLSQATQASLRLRGRNLKSGLSVILDPELKGRKESRQLAAEVLNDDAIANINKVQDPNSVRSKIIGPAVSWVEPETLREVLTQISDVDNDVVDATINRFKDIDKPLSKRFAYLMRIITSIWALAIAIVFQVSTPTLIQQLSTDPELRQQYAALAPDVMRFADDTFRVIAEYEPIYENALNTMAERHPDLADAFQSVDTKTQWAGDISEELSDLIDGVAEQDEILAEIEDIIYADIARHREEMLRRAGEAQQYLSLIDITPFRYGDSFYRDEHGYRMDNILGVLMTAILILLGGQFWYKALKTAVSFRDLLAPSEAERKSTNTGEADK